MEDFKVPEDIASKTQVSGSIPTGTIVSTIVDIVSGSAPTGWLECNGAEVPISTYYNLSQRLGTTYGSLTDGLGSAGSTHFRLPNLKSSYLIPKVSTDNVNSGGLNNHQHLVTAAATSANNGNAHNHNIAQANYGGDYWAHNHSATAYIGANGTNPPNANKTGTGGSGTAGGAAHTHDAATGSSTSWNGGTQASYHNIASLGQSPSGVDNHSHTASAAGSNSISANSLSSNSFPNSYVVRFLIKV
jgi:microcystin-dependent protein